MSRNIIHIGAPKTASTTLQYHLFMSHPDIYCIGEEGLGCDCIRDRHTIQSMETDDDTLYKEHEFELILDVHRGRAGSKVFVFSDVDIMASPIPSVCAGRLRRYFVTQDTQILIVLRDQVSAIQSYYMSHGKYLKPAPPSLYRKEIDFDDWFEFCKVFENKSPLCFFDYYRIVKLYSNYFGKNRVHILFYEDIVDDPDKFGKQLSNVLGVDVDMAKVFKPRERRGPKPDFIYKRHQLNYIYNRYNSGNLLLSTEYDLNLVKYGYPICTTC